MNQIEEKLAEFDKESIVVPINITLAGNDTGL